MAANFHFFLTDDRDVSNPSFFSSFKSDRGIHLCGENMDEGEWEGGWGAVPVRPMSYSGRREVVHAPQGEREYRVLILKTPQSLFSPEVPLRCHAKSLPS